MDDLDTVSRDWLYAPFPWPGGKRNAAPVVWRALGDPATYVEPFFGGGAVLLRRPAPPNRVGCSEIVNDADGFVANFWRAVRSDPGGVADACSQPVIEADLHARHRRVLEWMSGDNVDRLAADIDFCDARIAGWWAWGLAVWIGTGWCSGSGAWGVDDAGRLRRAADGAAGPFVARQIPSVGHRGVVSDRVARSAGWDTADSGAVAEWLHVLQVRLRHVKVMNGDWRRVTTPGVLRPGGTSLYDDRAATGVFLDPPYDGHDGVYRSSGEGISADVRGWCATYGNTPQYRIVLAGYCDEHDDLLGYGWSKRSWFRPGVHRPGASGRGPDERLWLSPHCADPGVRGEQPAMF